MANDEHLAVLRQGVDAWNAWRQEHPDIAPNLSGANLSEAKLVRANLSEWNFVGVNLREANLVGTKLFRAELNWADLSGANLSGAKLVRAELGEADLSGANLSGAKLVRAELSEADLSRADLSEAKLAGAHLWRADLSEAKLAGAHLWRANLSGANLSGANLSRAYLRRAELYRANLSRTNLDAATLTEAIFNEANLSGANLSRVGLAVANLSHADLSGADLAGSFLNETLFVNVDFSATKGLDTCEHGGPSILDHRTLQRSGRLPLSFLRGCGLPDRLIDYLPSLLEEAIQYYSCFISYSSKDDAFAKRLHADLQNNGVRCWFAPHDLPIGAKTRDAIDEAIRLRDKVLLILSKNAIASDWVEDEVTKGFAEERRRKQPVLFPVRIDNTVLKTEEAWASTLRDQRNIGDFRKWKEHDAYEQAFERVLRDLKAVPG